ncbi:MAG: nucleoside hydrolase [Candidatus Limnocylindrales bacterium]
MTPGPVPLLIDCDTGIDDGLALLYACASPEAEIVAVTCTAGNVEARQVAENTRAVLELAGRADIEVALGREVPLSRQLVTTPETHGARGIGWAHLLPTAVPLSRRHSADLIVQEARRRPGELTLVTLAPLTNVALAVLREPELPRLLRRLVVMGGAYGAPGNTTPVSEWNVHVDPEAAQIVFRAWASAIGPDPSVPRVLALGLDVTERARLLPGHMAALGRRAGTDGDALEARVRSADAPPPANPVLRYVADSLRFYMEFHERYDGFYGAFIHDPLVVAVALDPALVRTRPVAVDVEVAGALTTGQTVADWRGLWQRTPNADLAVEADAATFLDRLVARLGGLAEEGSGVAS